jgi:hypothetical protein
MTGTRRQSEESDDLGRKSSGTWPAFRVGTVRRVTAVIRFVACVVVAALAAAHLAAGVEADHLACVAAHHGCGSASIASSCCCGGQAQAGSSGPALARYRAAPVVAPCSPGGPTTAVILSDADCAIVRPLPVVPADIPILVANLRL